jgi:hypothetical protein
MAKIVLLLLLLLGSENDGQIMRFQRQRQPSLIPSGKSRISPTTGVRIALPSE